MPKCLFCDNWKLTKEHAWPDWIVREFKRRMPVSARITGFLTQHGQRVHEWPTNSITYKRKLVCEPCNSGWMGQLEECTKPVLLPLILGTETELSVENQCTLAAWATLRTMVFDSLAPGGESDQYFTPQERAAFANSEFMSPPTNIHLWLGLFYGKSWRARFITMNQLNAVKDDGLHCSTSILHRVTFQVLTWKGTGRLPYERMAADGWDNGTVQVWPSPCRAVVWPPPQYFTDESVKSLADRFNPKRAAV